MNVRIRLIFGFVSVSALVLLLFGITAHRTATEISTENQLYLLLDLARSQVATQFAPHQRENRSAIGPGLNHSFESAVITLDQGIPTGLSNIQGKTISSLSVEALASLLSSNQPYGQSRFGNSNMLWALAEIPNTNQALLIAHQDTHDWANYTNSLGSRLFITAFMIIWVAVWAALIISKNIVRTLEKQRAAIEHQATHDDLTGLPNRCFLFTTIKKLIENGKGNRENSFALITLDINRFKEINDTIGHDSGDTIIREVTERLKTILPKATLISRTGGDEFAIIVEGDNLGVLHLEKMAERVALQLLQPISTAGLEITIDAGIGACIYPKDATDASTLMKCAEVAMYQAKSQNQVFLPYNTKYNPYSLKRLSLANDLRHATKDQFILYYQPKVHLSNKQTTGVEALVRWEHPTYGLIPPDDFISLAENNGLMGDITLIIIDLAMAQQMAWTAQGLNLQIAINLSVFNLLNHHLPQQIEELIEAHQVKPRNLKFEITESCLMSDPERAQRTLEALHSMDIRLSIDDFGTGYSSLAYLKNLPVTELKIDRTFVQDMMNNSNDQMIVKSTIDLAHNLGCSVVAEGIEDKQTYSRLIEMGCDMAQGYYLSRPLTAEELNQWFIDGQWPPHQPVTVKSA